MRRPGDPLLIGATGLLLCVSVLVVLQTLAWVGRPFPGFLVLENRVIASAGLLHWPATQGGAIYHREIVAVDGAPLSDVAALQRRVAAEPPGTSLRYELRGAGGTELRETPTRRFEASDWALLFGTYLLCGIGLGATALCIRYLRGRDPVANGAFPALYVIGLWALTGTDLYGPHRLFRLHAACETALFAAVLHLALVFPRRSALLARWRWLPAAPYAAAAALGLVYQWGLYDVAVYRVAHRTAVSAFGVSLVVLILSQIGHYLRAPDFEVRQRVKVVALGTVLALGPQVFLALLAPVTGTAAPQNVMAFSGMLFPLSIAYAVLRHNLLDVDELVRRTLNYAILTACVTLVYVGAVVGFEDLFHRSPFGSRGTFALVFAPVGVVALLPLRDRMQSAVDRVFFRTAYDFRRIVETASARLASVAELAVLSRELERAVGETLHPEWMALYVRREPHGPLRPWERSGAIPEAAPALLAACGQATVPVDGPGGVLGVPFRGDGELIAVLLLGRRRSGRFYGGDDRRLLQTLANQGAVAIEHALALEQLRDLNRDLEGKVAERTRDLAGALAELRDTQTQLVHREKMASVGQFVAGIAHEINNPLAFIEGNLHFLRSYTGTLARALARLEAAAERQGELRDAIEAIRREEQLDEVLGDLESVFDGCAEGVQRTTSLVRDLRTFSRVDDAECMPIDLHEAFDSTLNLLRSKLVGIELVRDYGEDVPLVECLAGQVNQVLMNLLANACDAVAEGGRITVRTRCAGARVVFEVEDDGCGIEPAVAERIFDPFYTTKEVGQGAGLGLSISYGVVARHGGSLRVQSEPGRGACFRVELPVRFAGDRRAPAPDGTVAAAPKAPCPNGRDSER